MFCEETTDLMVTGNELPVKLLPIAEAVTVNGVALPQMDSTLWLLKSGAVVPEGIRNAVSVELVSATVGFGFVGLSLLEQETRAKTTRTSAAEKVWVFIMTAND